MATPPSVIIQVGANASGVTTAIQQAAQRAQNILTRSPIKINSKSFGNFKGLTADVDQFSKSLTRMSAVIQTFGQSAAILFGIQNAFVGLIKSTIEVEKQIASIGVVFGKTGKELEAFSSGIFAVAKNTGQTFDVAAKAAEEFARQGLGAAETLKRTQDALILVRTTGLNVDSAVEALTATFNTFKGEVADTTKIVNLFRNVDTGFAVSAADLAEGIKRAGATATDAKVSISELSSLITTLKQNTGRSGSVIGNSLKSIFTNLQNSDTLDTLQSIGVSTLDLEGNIRPAVEILTQLASKIQNLSDVQAAQVKSTIAGKFQINSLNSLLQDLSSSYSTYSQVLKVANNTTNEAEVSNQQLNKTLAATLNAATVNLTQFAAQVGNITITPLLKELVGGFNSLFTNTIDGEDQGESLGKQLGQGILQGIGAVISGPGLLVAFTALFKISRLVLSGAASQLKSVLSISAQNERVLAVQQSVLGVMQSQDAAILAALGKTRTRQEYEATVLAIIREQNAALLTQQSVSRGIAIGAVGRRTFASGYVPSFASEKMLINKGVGGAPSNARPVTIRNFNLGRGKRETITANSSEYIVPNFDSSGGSAIYNRDMIKNFGLPPNAKKIYAGGYVPNLAVDPLRQAVGREILALKSLGFSGRQAEDSIRVQGSRQLATPDNPSGLGVFNTLQGQTSIGKAINDHRGENIKRAGIPNLAPLSLDLPGYGRQRLNTTPSALQGGGSISAAVTRTNQLVSVATRDLLRYSETLANSAKFVSQNKANFRNAEQLLTRFSESQRSVFATLKGRAVNTNDAAATTALPTVLGRVRDNADYRNSFQTQRNLLTEERRRLAEDQRAQREAQRAQRAQRLQGGLIGASIAVPLLAGQIAATQKDRRDQELTSGIGGGIGSGLLLASLFGGPAGLIAGGTIAGGTVASSIFKRQRAGVLDLEGTQRNVEAVSSRREQTGATIGEFQRGLADRSDALLQGNSQNFKEITSKLIDLTNKIEDPALAKTARDAITSGQPLESLQRSIAELAKVIADKDLLEQKTLEAIRDAKESAEGRAGFFTSLKDFFTGSDEKGFRGTIGSDKEAKTLAETIAKGIPLEMAQSLRSEIQRVANFSGPTPFENQSRGFIPELHAKEIQQATKEYTDFANAVPPGSLIAKLNPAVAEQLKQLNEQSPAIDFYIAKVLEAALAKEDEAKLSKKAIEAQTSLVDSSRVLIEANKRYTTQRRLAQTSAFDRGISVAQESLNNPSTNINAKVIGEGIIARAQIRQSTLDSISSLVDDASEFIQDKLKVQIGSDKVNAPQQIKDFINSQVNGDPLTAVMDGLKNLTISSYEDKFTRDKLLSEVQKIKQINDNELKKLFDIEKIQRDISLKTKATEISKTLGDKEALKGSNDAFSKFLNIINPKKLENLTNRVIGAPRYTGSVFSGRGPTGGRQDGINIVRERGAYSEAFLANEEARRNLGLGDFNTQFGLNQKLNDAANPDEFAKIFTDFKRALDIEVEKLAGPATDRARSRTINQAVGTIDAFRGTSAGRNVGQGKSLEDIVKILQSGNEFSISTIPALIEQIKSNVGRGGNLTTDQRAAGLEQLDALALQLKDSLSILSDPSKLATIGKADAQAIAGTAPLEVQKLNELVISSNNQLTSLNSISDSARSIHDLLKINQTSAQVSPPSVQLDKKSLDEMKAITENIAAKIENFIQFDITGAVSIDGTDKEAIKTQLEPFIRTIVTDVINKDRIMSGNKTPVKTSK